MFDSSDLSSDGMSATFPSPDGNPLSTSINPTGHFSPSFPFGGDIYNAVKYIHSNPLYQFLLIFCSQVWALICHPTVISFKMRLMPILYPLEMPHFTKYGLQILNLR